MTIVLPKMWELSPEERGRLMRAVTPVELAAFQAAWGEWAHDGQLEPAGDWRTWVMMAGRGFGKTRAGAEWVHGLVRAAEEPVSIALVAATVEEGRRVMVEGPSGLLAVTGHASGRGSSRACGG